MMDGHITMGPKKMHAASPQAAIIIPVYNHANSIRQVVIEALKLPFPVVVIDDGSTDGTWGILQQLSGVHLVRHRYNRGKGAALMSGFKIAAPFARWAITLDADGQHQPKDAIGLLRAIPSQGRPIVVGKRSGMESINVPWSSRFGRRFSNFWVWLAGGGHISDSQSGFRVYPLPECLRMNIAACRFQFEIEVLVKAAWCKMAVIEAPVRVCYRPRHERISHFRPFIDFLRNSQTFARLIFQRIVIPRRIRSKLKQI